MRRGRSALTLLVSASALVLTAVPASATTTVKVEGTDVTIVVKVDCVGCKDYVAPTDGSDLAKYWEKTAEKAWNDAFDKFSYCNKYRLHLDIKMTNRSADSSSRFGPHRLAVTPPDGSGFAGAGWGSAPEGTPGGPQGQRTSDGTRYYEFDGEGTMPADATPTVIAHEFGHVIGLGDDRDTAGNALPNSGKTLMVGGGVLPDGTKITPNTKLAIGQDLVNRVGDQVANNGAIECGNVWRGSIHGSGDNVGYCDNTTNHDGTFVVRERPRSAPSITAHIDNTAGSGCGSAGLPNRTEYDFRTEGTKTSDGFRFGPDAILLYDIRLRGHGDRITGNGRYQEGVYRVIIRLEGERDDD